MLDILRYFIFLYSLTFDKIMNIFQHMIKTLVEECNTTIFNKVNDNMVNY